MACTNKVLDGSMLRVYVDGVVVAKDTSTEITIENSSRETTSKTSGGWKSFIGGSKGFTLSGEALFISDTFAGTGKKPIDIFNLLNNGTVVTIKVATTQVGDGYFEGSMLVNNMSVSSGNSGENVTYSWSGQGTGALEFKTT